MDEKNYEKFECANKVEIADVRTNLECKVDFDTDQVVKKVLSLNVSSCGVGVVIKNKEAVIEGNLLCDIVYLTESGFVSSASYKTPFSASYAHDKIMADSVFCIDVKQCFGKVCEISNNVARVECETILGGYFVYKDEVIYLSNASDDVCLKTSECDFLALNCNLKMNFEEFCNVEIDQNVAQILMNTTAIKTKSVNVQNGFCVVSYDICSSLLCVTNNEGEKIVTYQNKIECKQEFEIQNCDEQSMVDVSLCIDCCKKQIKIVEEEGKKIANISYVVNANVICYKNEKITVIEDLYSTTHNVLKTNSSYNHTNYQNAIYFDKKIEGSLTLDDNQEVDKLIASCAYKTYVLGHTIEKDNISISGLVQTNLMYLTYEGDVDSVDVEIPYVINLPYNNIDNDKQICDVTVAVMDIDVLIKKGKDVYVDCTISGNIAMSSESTSVVISDVVHDSELKEKDCSLEIYFARQGESVWNVAKNLNVPSEIIYNQNHIENEVFEEDKKVVLYYKK